MTMELNTPIDVAIQNLKGSAMFHMSLGSKELFHSNFLQWIFSIDKEMFERIVNNLLGFEMKFHDDFDVKREYNNYDLCVVHELEKSENSRKKTKEYTIDLIIENKVKSIPNINQLKEYYYETTRSEHLLLTLITTFVSAEALPGNWKRATYTDLAKSIAKAVKSSKVNEYYAEIIQDYIGFVQNLNLIAEGCSIYNTDSYFNPHYAKLSKIRINDLIEKLRTSEIAMQLTQRINDLSDKLNTDKNALQKKIHHAQSLARDAMFQTCGKGDFIINYGLTHAQGLVELKVIVKSERKEKVALVIQVQGDRYSHAVELWGSKKDYKKNWDNVYGFSSPYRWFLFPDDGLPSKNGREYNKYGNEFLYRYQKIDNEQTVENIITRICADFYEIFVKHILIGTNDAD